MAHPLNLERAAAVRVSKDFARIKAAIEAVLARNQDSTNAAELLAELRIAAASAVDVTELRSWVLQHVEAIARFNAQQLTRSVGFQVPEAMNAKTRAKLASISLAGVRGVPREMVSRIAPVVKRAIATGERGKAFEAEVSAKLGLSKQKARRVAIGTVIRSNAALTEQRHLQLGITEYTWRASPDRLTRAWHRKLNGKRFRYDKPPKGGGGGPHDHGNPGSADTCRCQQIPVIPAKAKARRTKPQ